MTDNSIPVVIREWKRNWWLVSIDYHVEDRRPDCTAEEYRSKYKHYLTIRVLWSVYNWTFRTEYEYDELPYER